MNHLNTYNSCGSVSRYALWLTLLLATPACIDQPNESEAVGSQEAPIIGGRLATETDQRATVLLNLDNKGLCTGTLIAPTVVVTAAHCCFSPQTKQQLAPNQVNVAVGALAPYDPNAEWHAVSKVIAHPGYAGFMGDFDPEPNPEGLGTVYDIGLLILQEPATDHLYVPVLPKERIAESVQAGAPLTISGYGLTSDPSGATPGNPPGNYPDGKLHIGETSIDRVGQTEMAVGLAAGVNGCMGDSGGPAYLNDDNVDYLVGVTSRQSFGQTIACGAGSGIWTLASAYEPWIITNSGGAYPPQDVPEPTSSSSATVGASSSSSSGSSSGSSSSSSGAGGSSADPEFEVQSGCRVASGHSSEGVPVGWLLGLLGLAAYRTRSTREG